MSIGESSTPLGKVRGLGSAHEGGDHWVNERVLSLGLLILGVWLIASLLILPDLSLRTVTEWLHAPSAAVPMALFIVIAFKHALDGLKAIAEDYVPDEGSRFALNFVVLAFAVAGAALSLFAVARVAFGAGA